MKTTTGWLGYAWGLYILPNYIGIIMNLISHCKFVRIPIKQTGVNGKKVFFVVFSWRNWLPFPGCLGPTKRHCISCCSGCRDVRCWGLRAVTFKKHLCVEDKMKLLGGFKDFVFSPLVGDMIQFDYNISQMGWFNHQLVKLAGG